MEGAVSLIYIATGETEANINSPHRETSDYAVGVDLFNKDIIVATHRDQINATIASLCIASVGMPINVKKLRSDVYLINELNKPVYSIDFSSSGEGFSSTQITEEIIKKTHDHLKRRNNQTLSKIYRLLTQAISRDNDGLRRFMFGWAGLEILIKSVFSDYEKVFAQSLLASDPANPKHRYFKRVREVMKGKYNIADQFVIVAACIGNGPVEADIEEFVRIKKIRDALFHDTSTAEKGLPGFEVIELLKKYLRLHTSTKGSQHTRNLPSTNE